MNVWVVLLLVGSFNALVNPFCALSLGIIGRLCSFTHFLFTLQMVLKGFVLGFLWSITVSATLSYVNESGLPEDIFVFRPIIRMLN